MRVGVPLVFLPIPTKRFSKSLAFRFFVVVVRKTPRPFASQYAVR